MIKRFTALVIAIFSLTAAFSFCSFADNQTKAVFDDANLFTPEETAAMENAVKEHFSDTKYSFYVVTATSKSGDVEYTGEDFIREYLNGDEGESIVLIITDGSEYWYDLYTYGKPDRRISTSEANDILDTPDVFNNIKGGKNYLTAVTVFMQMSKDACEPKIGAAIALGIIFGLIAAAATMAGLIYTYKKKSRSDKYPLNQFATLDLKESQDIFAGTFITKRIISQGSGSKGGRGFGGGGGAGHRGGR